MAAALLPPPLRDGDQLTADEFIRRWESMPDLKHAELIDGIVYMPSPVSLSHAGFHAPLTGWLVFYAANTPSCQVGVDGTWLMGKKDVPQPDIALRILPEHGGQSRVEGNYAAGAPELIVEVAVSSSARDLGAKLQLYERAGVREYLIAWPSQQQFLWRELTTEGYRTIGPGPDGIFRSPHLPGLWLDPEALWRLDLAGIFAVLNQGLATPEHAAFLTAR